MDSNKKPTDITNITSISDGLLHSILLRLPAEKILQFSITCKQYKDLLSDTIFHTEYMKSLSTSTSPPGTSTFLVACPDRSLSGLVIKEEDLRGLPGHTPPVLQPYNLSLAVRVANDGVLGSVDGLFGFRDSRGGTHIINPANREYKIIGFPVLFLGSLFRSSGFGYSKSNKAYKLVIISPEPGFPKHNIDNDDIFVYTLGENEWRHVGNLGLNSQGKEDFFSDGETQVILNDSIAHHAVHVDGTLYFQLSKTGRVLLFDLDEEKFTRMLPSPRLSYGSSMFGQGVSLRNINGRLLYSIGGFSSEYCSYWWLTKDMSWERAFENDANSYVADLKACIGDNKIVHHQVLGESLGFYRPNEEERRPLLEVVRSSFVSPHVNTLVSMRTLGEGSVKIVSSKGGPFDNNVVSDTVALLDMFTPVEASQVRFLAELESEIEREMRNCPVKLVKVYEDDPDGLVLVTFNYTEAAQMFVKSANGAWFRRKQVRASIYDESVQQRASVKGTRQTYIQDINATRGLFNGVEVEISLYNREKVEVRVKSVPESASKAVREVNSTIRLALIGKDPTQQTEIDNLMLEMSEQKLEASAILAVSLAVCKAGACALGIPLYKHIAKLAGNEDLVLPAPAFNVTTKMVTARESQVRHEHGMQKFVILPVGAKSFKDALDMGKKVDRKLEEEYEANFDPHFVPNTKEIKEGLEKAIAAVGFTREEVVIGTDLAPDKTSSENLVDVYKSFAADYPIVSIENPFDQEDSDSYSKLTAECGNKVQIVKNDLLVTFPERLQEAITKKLCNTLLLKDTQIGTVTESIAAVKLSKNAGWGVMTSYSSVDNYSVDNHFIADLTVGLAVGKMKMDGLFSWCGVVQRLLQIEEELGSGAIYARM